MSSHYNPGSRQSENTYFVRTNPRWLTDAGVSPVHIISSIQEVIDGFKRFTDDIIQLGQGQILIWLWGYKKGYKVIKKQIFTEFSVVYLTPL